MQIDDKLVLTDPVFTETVTQVSRRELATLAAAEGLADRVKILRIGEQAVLVRR